MKFLRTLLSHWAHAPGYNKILFNTNRLIFREVPEADSEPSLRQQQADIDAQRAEKTRRDAELARTELGTDAESEHSDLEGAHETARAGVTATATIDRESIGTEAAGKMIDVLEKETLQGMSVKLSKDKIKGRFLEDIAREQKMTYDDLVTLNKKISDDFHIVAHGSKHYCYANDEVWTFHPPVVEAAAADDNPVVTALQERRSERDAATERILAERAAEQTREEAEIVANYRELKGTSVRLPKWLRHKRKDRLGEALASASRGEEGAEALHITQALQPFGWTDDPQTFLRVVRQGIQPGSLTFSDLTKAEFGRRPNGCFKDYESLPGLIEGTTREIAAVEGKLAAYKDRTLPTDPMKEVELQDKLAHLKRERARYEQSVRQYENFFINASNLFESLAAIEGGTVLEDRTEHQRMLQGLEVADAPNYKHVYDFNVVMSGEVTDLQAGRRDEGIAVNTSLTDTVKDTLEGVGATWYQRQYIDEAFVLRLAISLYGIPYLESEGCLKKTEDNLIYLESLPTTFPSDAGQLGGLVDSLGIEEEGRNLVFNQHEADQVRVQILESSDQNLFVLDTLRTAFAPGLEVTMASGEGLRYQETTHGTRRADAAAPYQYILDRHTTIAPDGTREVDYEGIWRDMDYYIELGVEQYLLDPSIDVVTTIEEILPEGALNDDYKGQSEREALDAAQKAMKPLKRKAARIEFKLKERVINQYDATEKNWRAVADDVYSHDEKVAEWMDELYEPSGLNDQIKEHRTVVTDIIERHIGPLRDALDLDLETGEERAPLTETQINFLRNGYIYSLDQEHVGNEVMRKHEIIEAYESDPITYQILKNLVASDSEGRLSSADIAEAARIIQESVYGQDIPITTFHEQLGSDQIAREHRDLPTLAAGGATTSEKIGDNPQELTSARAGAALIIKLPKGFTVNVGIAGGWDRSTGLEASAGAGVSFDALHQVENWSLTFSVDGGARISETTNIDFGLSASAIGGHTFKGTGLSLYGGVSTGFRIAPEEGITLPTSPVMGHFGLRWINPERQLERKEGRGRAEGLVGWVEEADGSTERLERIKQVPGFRDIIPNLDGAPEGTEAAILNDMFEVYAQEMEVAGLDQGGVFPVTGFHIMGPLPFPPFVLPLVSFAFAGKTKVYPLLKEGQSIEELSEASYQRLQEDIDTAARDHFSGAEVFELLDAGGLTTVVPPEYGYKRSGEVALMPDAHTEMVITPDQIEAMLAGNLESFNQSLRPHGFEFQAGEGNYAGLLNLSALYPEDMGEVEIALDPTLTGRSWDSATREEIYDPGRDVRMVVGDTPQDIHLAADQFTGDLIVMVQTFYEDRRVYDRSTQQHQWTKYKRTIVTIKGSTDINRNANQFAKEGAPIVRYDANGLNTHFEAFGNVMSTAQYFGGQREQLEAAGVLSTTLIEHAARDNDLTAATLEALEGNEEFRRVQLETVSAFTKAWFEEGGRERLGFCLTAMSSGDMGESELATTLAPILDAALAPRQATAEEVSYAISVLRQEVNLHIPDDQKEAFARRHRAFFRKALESQLGSSELADQVIEDVIDNFNYDRMTDLPDTAHTMMVVGRAGVIGMKHDVIGEAMLHSYINYSDNAAMKEAALNLLRGKEMPTEAAEFLRTSLSLNVYRIYLFMKGPEAKAKLDAIYENPSSAGPGGEHEAAYQEFRSIVEQFRAAEVATDPRDQVVVIPNHLGQDFVYQVRTDVYGGVLEDCSNPTIATDSKIILAPLLGMREAVGEMIKQGSDYEANRAIFELLAGYWHRTEKEEGGGEKGSPSGEGEGNEDDYKDAGDTQDAPDGGNETNQGADDSSGNTEGQDWSDDTDNTSGGGKRDFKVKPWEGGMPPHRP